MVAVLKSIVPDLLKVDRIRLELLNGLRRFGRSAIRDVKKITDPWDNEKPNWSFKISLAGGNPSVFIDAGDGLGANKWLWLDEGTSERPAIMSSNFVPKTQPGVLSSGSGQGGLVFINPDDPQPGIEAREFSKNLIIKWTPMFQDIMQEALDKGARLSSNYIKG